MSELPPKKPARKPSVKKTTATNGSTAPAKPRKPRQPRTKAPSATTPSQGQTTPRPRAPSKRTGVSKKTSQPSTGSMKWSALVILLLLMLSVGGWGYWSLLKPLTLPSTGYKLTIPQGASYYQTIEKMDNDGVIASPLFAKLYIRVAKPKALHTGTYLFKAPITLMKLLSQLAKGEGIMMNKMTVIEGTTFKQLRAQLAKNTDVKQTLTAKTDAEVLLALGLTETHPEGLFAPDTYIFPPNETDVKILKRLYHQQQSILQKAWAGRAANLPYRSAYEALIMASIVEKETGNKIERAQIAGVFVRRLQVGMRLQTDPTVIYGMGDSYNGNIRKADLLTFTPYNTYRINGLPPTPIALPSKAAIEAALHPAESNAVYFVAKGDGSGTHNFTDNLAAHNQAVQAYLQARKGNP